MPVLTDPLSVHPCFGVAPAGRYGRIHLPVAPECNVQCAFCDRRYDCANECRPGVTSRVLSPEEAVARTRQAVSENPAIVVAGIAGPGDALANEAAFETLALLRRELPSLILCVSTNGLLLPEKADALAACGVSTVTVTVNAATTETARRVYLSIVGGAPGSNEACSRLLARQMEGVARCASLGISVKINTVLMPGVNDHEIEAIARRCAREGACVMNIVPLIPCGSMKDAASPALGEIEAARARAGRYLRQFTRCRQCRADACGVI